MKKDNMISMEEAEIMAEIENTNLNMPKIKCSICGRETPAHEYTHCPRYGVMHGRWHCTCWERPPSLRR